MSSLSVVVVSAQCRGQIIIEQTSIRCSPSFTFEDIFYEAKRVKPVNVSFDNIKQIHIRQQPSAASIFVGTDMDISVLGELNCKFVTFEVERRTPCDPNNNLNELTSGPLKKNAFEVLMKKTIELPKKPSAKSCEQGKDKLIGPEKLLCDLIDMAGTMECGWTPDTLESGTIVLNKLKNALWYVDHIHKRLQESGCQSQQCFSHFKDFIERHGKSSHYGFQLKKCGNCPYCVLNPIRLDDAEFNKLHFLPDPIPDETGQHYKQFDQLYGMMTNDKHRPSFANVQRLEDEADRINRDVLKSGKSREDGILLRIKEDDNYACGDAFPEDS
ncbi:Hypothetical predicted protein [Mytilus galloprovincialis]|uniref:Uncharacterized protein n=1 Tax=Mytilus galloprovincialis TaxID=29158 RepID=A0A8B6E494_MYTGA|nr:Hypothetical predicted protein [Mytilus galloprovincialis]